MRLSFLSLLFTICLLSTSEAMHKSSKTRQPSSQLVDREEGSDEGSDEAVDVPYTVFGRPQSRSYNLFSELEVQGTAPSSKTLRRQRRKKNLRLKKQGLLGKGTAPIEVLTSPKFIREVVNLVATIVPYKMSMWAVSEVFPTLTLDHPDVKATLESPQVKSIFEHALMRKVTDLGKSNFIVYTTAIISLFLVPFLGYSARIVRAVRRSMFAVSFGLLLASLSDMFLDAISTKLPDNVREFIEFAERVIEMGVFFIAAGLSMTTSFGWQVVASILGSIVIHGVKHFIVDGKFDSDVNKSFMNSKAARETKEAAATVSTIATEALAKGSAIATDAIAKGQDMIKKYQGKDNGTETTSTVESKPAN